MVVKEDYLTRKFLQELVCLQCADTRELATRIKPISTEHRSNYGNFKAAIYEIALGLEGEGIIEKDSPHAEELERKYREAGQLPESEMRYAIPWRIK